MCGCGEEEGLSKEKRIHFWKDVPLLQFGREAMVCSAAACDMHSSVDRRLGLYRPTLEVLCVALWCSAWRLAAALAPAARGGCMCKWLVADISTDRPACKIPVGSMIVIL